MAERRADVAPHRAAVPAATSAVAIVASALGFGACLALVGAFGVVGLTALQLGGPPAALLERA